MQTIPKHIFSFKSFQRECFLTSLASAISILPSSPARWRRVSPHAPSPPPPPPSSSTAIRRISVSFLLRFDPMSRFRIWILRCLVKGSILRATSIGSFRGDWGRCLRRSKGTGRCGDGRRRVRRRSWSSVSIFASKNNCLTILRFWYLLRLALYVMYLVVT